MSKENMEVTALQKKFVKYVSSLIRQKFVDDQFKQLYNLQDEINPNFVKEEVSEFFKDSEILVNDLSTTLGEIDVDFKKVYGYVQKLKRISSILGLQTIINECSPFFQFCHEKNLRECLMCIQRLKLELLVAKNEFEILFRLEQEIVAAGGSVLEMK